MLQIIPRTINAEVVQMGKNSHLSCYITFYYLYFNHFQCVTCIYFPVTIATSLLCVALERAHMPFFSKTGLLGRKQKYTLESGEGEEE